MNRKDLMTYREKTKVIRIGDRVIGGGNPILIQSMTNTPTASSVQALKKRARIFPSTQEIQ